MLHLNNLFEYYLYYSISFSNDNSKITHPFQQKSIMICINKQIDPNHVIILIIIFYK